MSEPQGRSESRQSPPRERSSGPRADAYDRARPSYPADAASWLTGAGRSVILELGAGTGKLTAQLVALGHDVHATEPDPKMLAILEKNLPNVRVSQATAEETGDAVRVRSVAEFSTVEPEDVLTAVGVLIKEPIAA